jgi:hypothetical protein
VFKKKSQYSINIHISIETFVRIHFEHNPYVHDLSMNQVDNVLVQEQVVTFFQDQKQHANILKSLFIKNKKKVFFSYFIRY